MVGEDVKEATGPPLWAVAILTLFLGLGVVSAPAAGSRDGDFVHLWLGGHVLWAVGPEGLYDPSVHRTLLADAYAGAPPEALWAGRNDRLGAFFYPPPMGLFYGLFGGWPVHLAGTIHAIVSLAGVSLAGALVGRLSQLGMVLGMVLVLTTPALFHNHVLGQNGGWALLVLAGAGVSLRKDRDLLAGVLLGLLIGKPSWLVAVGWVPAVMGRWRTVLAMVASVLAMMGGSAMLLGVETWRAWASLAPELAVLSQAGDYPLHLQYSLWGLGRRIAGLGLPGDLLGGTLALAVLGATVRRMVQRDVAVSVRLALGLCAASLINPHLHPYDVTGGIFALAILLSQPKLRRLGWVLLVVHHGGQAMEGLQGSGWMIAPATVGLILTWGTLWWFGGRRRAVGGTS